MTADRKRILFLSQCLPYPPHSGVTRRTYHILLELQREFDVSLVAFSRRDHQPDSTSLAKAGEALRGELSEVLDPIPIESDRSLTTKLRNHALSVISRRPYIFYEYGDARFERALRRTLAVSVPRFVHLDSLDMYRWRAELPACPIACTHHNLESYLLRLQADHFPNPVARAYMKHQADLVERVERRLCPTFDLNVMTSEADAERLTSLAPAARTVVIPNGVDVDFFQPGLADHTVSGRVAFLGPTYMFANRDAVDYFLGESWPFIRSRLPHSTFHLVGKNSEEDKARFEANPGVRCNGHVPDIRPHFAEACVSVVPIRVGGGTRLKILDAWAMGKAVVSTSVGCEGLETVDGSNILIRDDPRAFAQAVIELLSDAALRNRLGREARRTAEEKYSWRVVGQKLVGLYQELAEVPKKSISAAR